jgi:hypothetical protein
MKFLAPTLCMLLTLSANATPIPLLRFTNTNTLTGTPQSLNADNLVWDSKLLEGPVEFPTSKIHELNLPASQPDTIPDYEAVISLTNGDTIRGQLASLTDEDVTLDTWFAGRLKFNRLMVSSVKIEKNSAEIYRGPSSLDGWVHSSENPAWIYSQSAFRSVRAGSIARDDLLVDQCSIRFDIAWKGDSIRFKTILFSDDPTTDTPGNGYEINFMRGRVHLRDIKTGRFHGSGQSRALMEDERAAIEIRASNLINRIALFINDQLIDVWDAPEVDSRANGTSLHFIDVASSPTKISNIRISEWDGVMDRMPTPQPGFRQFGRMGTQDDQPKPESPDGPAEDRMKLANGDSLPGEVASITEGVISLQTPLGEINLPVSRLSSIALKQQNAERCKRYNGDVRAWFPDGTSVVFRLDSGDGKKLNVFSQNFGDASFDTSAFNRIEFNIHSPEFQSHIATDNW